MTTSNVAPSADGVEPIGIAAMFSALPHLIWAADADGNAVFFNDRWYQATGLTRDASLGPGWTVCIAPANRNEAIVKWRAAVRSSSATFEQRVPLVGQDGCAHWHLWRAVRAHDDAAAGFAWLATFTDIDDQVAIEASLVASEERYRSIIERTQEGVLVIGPDARLRYANRPFAAMLGYDPDELFGISVFELFPPDDRPMAAEQFARRRNGEAGAREYRFLRRDASDLWTITTVNPIFDPDGSFIGSIGMVTDITERKAMENRLATAAAEYESLAEATPQIVWSAEADGSFDYVNARWTECTGITRAQARKWGWIPAVHRDDLSELLVRWRSALDTGGDFEASLRLRCAADDEYRWHVMRARPLRGDDGEIVRWFGTLTDIHNERRTARQLEIIARTSTALAESLDREKLPGRLAALICGELAEFVEIVLLDEDRTLRVAATAHRDRAAAKALRECYDRRVIARNVDAVEDVTRVDALLAANNAAIIARTGATSTVTAPLHARGRLLGAIVAYAPPAAPFGSDETAIFHEIAARAAIALENAELYAREHRVSATLQQALLPTRLPEILGLQFDAIYEPGATEAQIGGDWYDAFEIPDGRVIVSIGDVTGRGLRAAVIMGRVRQAIEALATYQPDPSQLLSAADAVLRRTHPDAIVTALVGLIDLKRRTFAYATAGHPTPIVRDSDGKLVTLPGSGLPLGLRDAHQPPTSTIVLPSNAMLLLFTDGLVESTRDIDEGERRVFAALRDPAIVDDEHPAAAIKAAVLHDGSSDDVAVFTIRVGDLSQVGHDVRTESPLRRAWSMHWSFDARDARSTRDVRDLYLAYLRAKGTDNADYAAAELVFGELLSNVVRHAPGTVDIEVEWRGSAPVLHVLDRGPGYDRAEALPPSLSETGRGLFIVSTLTREFTVTRLPGYGSHARAVLAIDRTS